MPDTGRPNNFRLNSRATCWVGWLCFITWDLSMSGDRQRRCCTPVTAGDRSEPERSRSHSFPISRGPTGKRLQCRCGICCYKHSREKDLPTEAQKGKTLPGQHEV